MRRIKRQLLGINKKFTLPMFPSVYVLGRDEVGAPQKWEPFMATVQDKRTGGRKKPPLKVVSNQPPEDEKAHAERNKAVSARKAASSDTPVLEGIKNPEQPVTYQQVWDFIKREAGDNPYNVEIVPLENVVKEAEKPFPFTNMTRQGPRSQVMWFLVNGCGETNCRRLSSFLKESGTKGASGTRIPDLLAAMNGGYSRSSKQWGTPFVMLRVIDNKTPPSKHH